MLRGPPNGGRGANELYTESKSATLRERPERIQPKMCSDAQATEHPLISIHFGRLAERATQTPDVPSMAAVHERHAVKSPQPGPGRKCRGRVPAIMPLICGPRGTKQRSPGSAAILW